MPWSSKHLKTTPSEFTPSTKTNNFKRQLDLWGQSLSQIIRFNSNKIEQEAPTNTQDIFRAYQV